MTKLGSVVNKRVKPDSRIVGLSSTEIPRGNRMGRVCVHCRETAGRAMNNEVHIRL